MSKFLSSSKSLVGPKYGVFALGIWLHVKKYLMQRSPTHPLLRGFPVTLNEAAEMCDKYSVSELPCFKTENAYIEATASCSRLHLSVGFKLYCIFYIS